MRKSEKGVAFRVSELQEWQSCARRYYWKYVRNLEPRRFGGVPRPVGTAVHKGVECIYKGEAQHRAVHEALRCFDEVVAQFQVAEEDRPKIAKGREQVRVSVGEYPYGPRDCDECIAIEQEYTLEMGGERLLQVRLDREMKVAGLLWVHDTKTTGGELDKVQRAHRLRMQYVAYAYVAREKRGEDVAGVMMDFIKKPGVYLRKDGGMTVSGQAFVREPIRKTEGDFKEFESWFHRIAEAIQEDGGAAEEMEENTLLMKGAFLKNTDSCLSFNSVCPYYELCAAPVRHERLIDMTFKAREVAVEEEPGGEGE